MYEVTSPEKMDTKITNFGSLSLFSRAHYFCETMSRLKLCPRKQTTGLKLVILVSFISGEVTSYTDNSYCIHILWEVCRSVFFWATLYNYVKVNKLHRIKLIDNVMYLCWHYFVTKLYSDKFFHSSHSLKIIISFSLTDIVDHPVMLALLISCTMITLLLVVFLIESAFFLEKKVQPSAVANHRVTTWWMMAVLPVSK